jgi:hypothetical protein
LQKKLHKLIVLPYLDKYEQEVLGRINLPPFPMAMVANVTSAKDCMRCNHNNPIKQSQTIVVQG